MSRPITNKIPLKLVIVGDGGTGKSSITIQILKRGFIEGDYDATIEDSYSTSLTLDGQEYEIEIIDTAGQEEYRYNLEGTCRQGDGFIITYAIDSQESFDQLPMFMHTIRTVKSEFEDCTQNPSPENTPFPFLLLGNKCDKPPQDRIIYAPQGLSFSRTSGGLFYECSAKLRVNIDSAFESIVRATARSKIAREEYKRQNGGREEGFNGNVAVLERLAEERERRVRGVGGGSTGRDGWEEEEEKVGKPRKKNPALAMDRRRSFSVGGLGRRPESLGKEPGCCTSCFIS